MYDISKRLIDVFFAVFLLLILWPIFLIIYFTIRIYEKGPAFFVHKRVGLKGKAFNLYKFRSMQCHAKGNFYTQENDPRITKIGHILRRLSFDELPQVFNLLRGDMTLIGPRPDVEKQQKYYTFEQREKRNSILPGITGLAQATKRSLATFEERIALDLEYVEKRSFILDCQIIVWTIKNILRKNGN